MADTELLELARATGLVIDRTVSPEVVLGQGCLTNHLRLATCASTVFNYVNAPASLAVKFPHSGLEFGVKRLTLHPGFNATYAHMHYLAQTGLPSDPMLVVPNDLALLSLRPDRIEPSADQLAQLEAALKPALDHYGAAESGVFDGGELANVIQKVRAEGKAGLLTLLNQRNKPVAYLSIGPGPQSCIKSIAFKNLTRNLALFELFYVKPGGTYLFQPSVPFPGPTTQEMNIPAEALLEEALRRSAETPQLMATLGGPEARYVPLEGASFNPEEVPASVRSLVGRLWETLDGYITLSQLSGRVETDTYLALRCISEMATNGLIRLKPESPFPGDGRLGTPLISVPSDILKEGEPLTAFYLDPISGKPCCAQGDFREYVESKDSNWLLHSVPCPPRVQGAPLLVGKQLVGLVSGEHVVAPGHSSSVRLYEAVGINALAAIGSKSTRTTTAAMELRFAMLEEQMVQAKTGPVPQMKPVRPQLESTSLAPRSSFEAEPNIRDNLVEIPQTVDLGRPVLKPEIIAVADSIGLVVDRAVKPELVLGQGCLTDKHRFSVCASAVSHYANAPGALAVKFPSGKTVYGVRTVTLHPDFNSRYARLQSFALTGVEGERPPVMQHDLALLVLEADIQEVAAGSSEEQEAELAFPISSEGQYGRVEGDDVRAAIEKVLKEGNPGVLSFLDERNRQIAHLLIAKRQECFIQAAHFNGLAQHLAVFELLYRKPRGAYHFETARDLEWPKEPDIDTSAKELLVEGERRAGEVPELMSKLGGPEARYVHLENAYDGSRIDPHALWMARRVWDVLDGFITLDQLWRRTRVDTYLSLNGLRELLQVEAVRLDPLAPYGKSEHFGQPLFPIHADALSIGDQLTGLFLDPVTARPYVLHGDFLGYDDPQNPACLLHSVPFPPDLRGGLVLADRQLLGFNTGLHDLEETQAGAGLHYELIATDALRDLRGRKQRISATRDATSSSAHLSGDHLPAAEVLEVPGHAGVPPTRDRRRRVLGIAAAVVGTAFLFCIVSYLLTWKGDLSEAVSPAPSEVETENSVAPGPSDSASEATNLEKLKVPAVAVKRVTGNSRQVFSGSINDYARLVEDSFQASYRPPQTSGKSAGKAVLTVKIAPHGKAAGFFLRRSSDDVAVDRHIIKSIVRANYPPAPYRPGENPALEFTIDGAQVHVAVPSK